MTSKFYFSLYMLVYYMVSFLFIYYPFRHNLRYDFKKVFVSLVIIFLINIISWIIILKDNYYNGVSLIGLKLAFSCFFMGISYYLVRAKFAKFLYIFLLQDIFITVIFWNTSFLDFFFLNNLNSFNPNIYTIVIAITQFIMCYPFVKLYLDKKIIPSLYMGNDVLWKYTSKLLICLCFVSIILMFYFEFYDDLSFRRIFARYSSLLVMYYVIHTHIKIINEVEQNSKLEKQSMYMSRVVTLLQEQYSSITENIKETRAARHDLRHHLMVIGGYLNMKDYENLTSYVNSYANTLPTKVDTRICNNYAIDALLQQYLSIAQDKNIKIDTKLQLDNNTSIKDCDLCVIFGNCIENAMEACQAIPSDKRNILIKSRYHNDMIIIAIDNNFNGKVVIKDQVYLSSKRSYQYQGIGLCSVRDIVTKYNGEMKIESINNIFRLSIMIKIK